MSGHNWCGPSRWLAASMASMALLGACGTVGGQTGPLQSASQSAPQRKELAQDRARSTVSLPSSVSSRAVSSGEGSEAMGPSYGPPNSSVGNQDGDLPVVTEATVENFDGAAADDWLSHGWQSEAAGAGEAVVAKGVGRMVVDRRGTYEWVRAMGAVGPWGDLELQAAVTPRTEGLGSVYIGLRGNGGWRPSTPYLPSSGVAVEYAFAPGIASELRIYQIDDRGTLDVGSVEVASLRAGQRGNMKVSLDGATLRAKVWSDDEDEPEVWAIEREVRTVAPGSIHLSYRDESGGTVEWDDLIVKPLR